MATRSFVVVRESLRGPAVNLYRHWDGYPAVAGAALLEACGPDECHKSGSGVVMALLAMHEPDPAPGGSTLHTAPRSHYEVAFCGPEGHGDLEHVYIATRRPIIRGYRAGWDFEHYARPQRSWDPKADDYRAWPCTRGDFNALAAVVNSDRLWINANMKARGADAEPYPLVALSMHAEPTA